MKSTSEVREWYNKFNLAQLETGVNLRHYTIFKELVRQGLKPTHRVLEIGCGIGTLTKLLAAYLKRGSILATDISDESIEVARKLVGKNTVEFVVTDMQNFRRDEKFDFIVLPDVLEHIPLDQHPGLFKSFAELVHDDSKVLIHIPHPKQIEFLRENRSEALRIIDQAVHADLLCENTYESDFILSSYRSYGLFDQKDDYAMIIFRPNRDVTFRPLPRRVIIIRKLFARIFFWRKVLLS